MKEIKEIQVQACLMHEGKLSPLSALFLIESVSEKGTHLGVSAIPVSAIPRVIEPKNSSDDTLKGLYEERGISSDMLKDVQNKIVDQFVGTNIDKANSLPTLFSILGCIHEAKQEVEEQGGEVSFKGRFIRCPA